MSLGRSADMDRQIVRVIGVVVPMHRVLCDGAGRLPKRTEPFTRGY